MIQLNRLRFQIRHPDGRNEQLDVDSERALIGSGSHCEIRLPRDQAAPEVLLIEERVGRIFAEARSFDPPPMVNGVPIMSSRLLEGATIRIGQCEISVELVQTADSENAGGKAQSGSNLLTYALVVALMGGALYMKMRRKGQLELPSAPAVSELWPSQKVSCEQRAQGPADALGREYLLRAEGRRERAPFHFKDGIQAVLAFEQARACFTTAANTLLANEAAAAAAALRKTLGEQFHTHQVRLERALHVDDYETASREVQILREFLDGRRDEYVTWLSNMDRSLKLKLSARK